MAEKTSIEKELEVRKQKYAITKANAAKEELEMKILERKLDVERMEDHMKLQDIEIKKAEERLVKLQNIK